MYNHAPQDYVCLFCSLVQNVESEHSLARQSDVVFQDETVTAFIATRKWPNNPGHVLVIPNAHFENIYDLPLDIAAQVHALARAVALAMKRAYGCDGITLRQHNEPAGGQHFWHYHLHVIPRYENDKLHASQKQPFPAHERAGYAQKLRNHKAWDVIVK